MSIRYSPKHGFNPSIIICPVCKKDYALALNGRINRKDDEAPMKIIGDICDDCKKKIEDEDLIFIRAIDEKTNSFTGYSILLPRNAIKCEIKGHIAFMKHKEFIKTFVDNETNKSET